MPIFEFFCEECRHRFERITRSGQKQADCPQCGKPAAKQVSVPSIGSSSPGIPSSPPPGCGSGGFT
ncbi:FmdB family zinc ribbon protein [Desulfuromonas versatilis]|uniref:FmdB family zinc ribbon protein n=1 Tax=Desulfuromonas versatilis TaxID=2802975 RepID=UPI001C8469EB